jgi:hypothetical protein
MDIKRQFFKVFHIVVSVVLIIQLSACGYFMYLGKTWSKTHWSN